MSSSFLNCGVSSTYTTITLALVLYSKVYHCLIISWSMSIDCSMQTIYTIQKNKAHFGWSWRPSWSSTTIVITNVLVNTNILKHFIISILINNEINQQVTVTNLCKAMSPPIVECFYLMLTQCYRIFSYSWNHVKCTHKQVLFPPVFLFWCWHIVHAYKASIIIISFHIYNGNF